MGRHKSTNRPLLDNENSANKNANMPKKSSRKRDIITISSDDESEAPPQRATKILRSSLPSLSSSQSSYPQDQYYGSQSSNPRGPDAYRNARISQVAPSSSQISLDPAEDEYGADEVVMWTQHEDDSSTNANEMYEQYGTLQTKIVGIRYYDGHATVGEHVLVRREPNNAYDRNAIRVDNVQRTQIGHIPRQIASKLAPYMDDGSLLLEARIAGSRGSFDCPLELAIYGTSHPYHKEHLRVRMQQDRLPLDTLKKREKEAKAKKAAELKKVAKKAGRVAGPSQQQWQAGINAGGMAKAPKPEETLDDIATGSERYNPREMKQMVESYGSGEDTLAKMPMADQPERLETQLLPYQRQALAWLIDRENPKLPVQGSKDIVQLWKRSSEKANLFTNIATNYSNQSPRLASGGILADDMGLGKTLEVISLMIADPNLNSTANDGSNSTLIVAPLSVISNWSGQMELHVKKSRPMNVLIYHGPTRQSMSPEDFSQYDVVITTYGTLTSQYLPGKANKPPSIPRERGLYSVNWRRIVLDEGHNIRNPNTKGALAATAILAGSRWVLTGTPIINSLKDLYSLVRFIGLTGGLESREVFNSVLIRPLKSYEEATLLLQALMATLCLRRRKEMSFVDLKLPQLDEYIHRIKFKQHEREKYDALQDEAKGYLEKYQSRRSHGNKSTQDTYRHLLEVLLRLRQVCNHWKLCGERVTKLMSMLDEQAIVELTPENRKALQDMLQLSIESREECPVCIDDLTGHNPVITHCGHIFGRECIVHVIETQHKCPMCRAELPDETILIEPAHDLGATGTQEEAIEDDGSGPSSKVEALLSILGAAHRKQGTKLVVFSQWCRFLDLVEPHLKEAGYKFVRLDGTMKAAARDASLRALEQDPKTTILLASLGVASVGLNLTAANQVVLCDTWWAPAIEDQAVDRVHRLGQKKDCTVWRLVMEESIEDRTLQVQADKRKLMTQAFQEKGGKRGQGSQARLGDIQRLLGQ